MMTLADLLKSTRQYFWDLDFTEVEVPYLNASLPLESNIYSFTTKWTHSQAKFYLPTSPEMALKKHLAEQKTDCFAISHCFRDLENSGPHHTPEFLMLEYYLVNKNLADLQASLKKFLNNYLKINYSELRLSDDLPNNEPDFNQYFLNDIEAKLPKDSAVFVTGYPAFLSPLAKREESGEVNNFFGALRNETSPLGGNVGNPHSPRKKNSLTSRRFELYINGIEIANGCEENRDAVLINAAFTAEKIYRQQNNLPLHPYSEEFIANCTSLPPCCGVGLGLERLLMILNHQNSL